MFIVTATYLWFFVLVATGIPFAEIPTPGHRISQVESPTPATGISDQLPFLVLRPLEGKLRLRSLPTVHVTRSVRQEQCWLQAQFFFLTLQWSIGS